MLLVLLPGMDGTGMLFKEFVRVLPARVDARVVSYPEDRYLTYGQLAERVVRILPKDQPYLIIAESYSGPVAALLASHPIGNLQAVVFVSSFVSLPCGRLGTWIAKALPAILFRSRPPAWILRWLLMSSSSARELTSQVQDAIPRVRPEVLAQRFRDALRADFRSALRNSTVRIVCLCPESDRLLGARGLHGLLDVRRDIEIVKLAGPHFLLQCETQSCLVALQKVGLI